MKEIYFVTSNENKLREAREILGINVNSVSVDVPEILYLYVKDIVISKAKSAYEHVRKPVLVEDTGLYLRGLNDFPGALVKWMLKTVGNDGICKLLKDEKNRSAYAETCVCLYDGTNSYVFSGRIDGSIPNSPRGEQGFGWDPIFQPEGYSITFAEMPMEDKNKMSMRKEAFIKLKEHLESK